MACCLKSPPDGELQLHMAPAPTVVPRGGGPMAAARPLAAARFWLPAVRLSVDAGPGGRGGGRGRVPHHPPPAQAPGEPAARRQRFGEGDLSVRVPEHGHDEVADLARQFNAAAERIETLMTSHKSCWPMPRTSCARR
jgi:hypothetical protein